MSVPLWGWLAALGLILVMLAVDLFAHRRAHVISVREAATWSAVWLTIGGGFGVLVWWLWGPELGQQYYSGYLIEKTLAVDNVFIWAVIFARFGVPPAFQHRVLFLGVLGALVLRGAFIAAGAALIAAFSWVLYVFAAILLVTGVKMLMQRNEHYDVEKSRLMRLFRAKVRMTEGFEGQRFLVRRSGLLYATPLLAVLVLVEATDVVFAVDSIPAIFAVTSEPFLVFTANAFALLGLRAMYFLLADLVHRFVYLKLGLSIVLIWVGIKMALQVDVVHIPTTLSLAVIVAVITVSILLSFRATRNVAGSPTEPEPTAAIPAAPVTPGRGEPDARA